MEMFRVIPDREDCGSSEMAVASHPLLSGILDSSIQRDELGFDTLSSMSRSSESSQLTENDHSTSSLAVPPHKMPSGLPDDALKRSDVGFDPLSSLHGSPKASKLTENTDIAWRDGTKSPEYFDCGPEPVNVSDVIPKEPTCIFVQKEEPCGDVQPGEPKPTQTSHPEVAELADERDSEDGNTAVPIRGFQSGESAVGGERDDNVVVLSDTERADRLQKELCCADVPSVPKRDKKDGEEVGDVVILEPTINKEVPASICRESSSPRLYEEYISKADEPSEDTSAHSGRVTECSVVEPSQQSVTCEQWQSDVASHTGVAARIWRKMAMQQPRYQLTCSSCLELFSSRYELIRHVFVHLDDIEPPLHVCVMCGEEFGTDKEVAEHHKNNGAQCYAFVSVVKIHLKSPDTVWFCSTCEQTFETEHRLAIHKAKRHLRTVISACIEMPVSVTKLDDVPQVRAENCHVCKRMGGRSPGLPQQEAFHRNYKRKLGRSSVHLQEAPHSNYERKPGQSRTTPEITVREPLNIKIHPIDVRSETMPRGRVGKNTEITSAEPPGRKRGRSPGYLNGEPLNGNPDGRKLETLESDASTLLELTREDSLSRKLEVGSGESFNIKPEMSSGEPVHRTDEVTLKEQLNRTADIAHRDTHDRRRETACGETFDRGKETARREIPDETSESARGKNLTRIPDVTPGEPLDKLSTVAQTPESLQNKSRIMQGEPFNSKIGMTPDHLIDSKPKKRRGRPPGSKNKNPSKPRARKPKTVSGGLPDGTPEVTVGKPLQVMRPGGSMDSLLEMTPGVPEEMLDEMRSGPPSGRRYGECLYDLVPGELPDRLHEMTPGEHLYGLHEIGQRDQLYSLHEMTPGVPPDVTPRESLDKLHDAAQGEPMYRLHEMTTVESVHRLHEMSPVEILYRNHESTPGTPLDTVPKVATAEPISSLHEMAPMDIHYRNDEINNRESTPVSPLNAIPKIPSAEPFNGLSEMPPPEPLRGLSEMAPAGILHRPSEMPPREPHRKLTEMAPVEPFRRPTEMTPSETLYREYKMAPGETPRRPSEIAPAEPLRRLSVMPPEESLLRLYEMEPRDPLHTLFEMATGDPFHTLFEMEPEDPFWSPSKMSPGEPYNRLSEMAPGQPLNNQSETAPGNFVNGVPKKRRGRPPGSKNRFPAKPRCKKSKTEPGEALDTKPKATSGESRDTVPPGVPSCTIPEILLGESGEKKSNKNVGEAEKWPCHFCHQLFCSLSGLKRHLVRHTGERNYVCDLCGESFARSDNLRVHRYTHTGGLPFKCDVCGRAFSWACHLRDHKRKCQSS